MTSVKITKRKRNVISKQGIVNIHTLKNQYTIRDKIFFKTKELSYKFI